MRALVAILAALALTTVLPAVEAADASVSVNGDNTFSPSSVTILAGERVTWTWTGGFHSVTDSSTSADWCGGRGAGSCDRTFPTPGTYAYHCKFHPGMTGTVVVDAPPSSNQAPAASFVVSAQGLDVTVNAGGSSDPDGSIVAFEWSWGDGTTGSTGQIATHRYAHSGTFTIGLTVRDDDGAVASTTRLATVEAPPPAPPPEPPRASFTVVVDGLRVQVDGRNSSSPQGFLFEWRWSWGDGSEGSGLSTTHTYAAPGNYTITLTVRDSNSRTGSTSRDVTVALPRPPNLLPEAAFTATVRDLELRVNASGSRDADGALVAYAWDWGDGTTGAGVEATHTYAAAATYVVNLTVTDDRGARAVHSRSIVLGPLSVGVRAKVTALQVRADPLLPAERGPYELTWSFGDGATYRCAPGAVCTASGPGSTLRAVDDPLGVVHRYVRDGSFRVRLVALDAAGATSVNETVVNVSSEPPLRFDVEVQGLNVTLDATQLPRYANATYRWTLDGRSLGATATVRTRVTATGGHDVTLTLRDDAGELKLSQAIDVPPPDLASILVPTESTAATVAPARTTPTPATNDAPGVGAALVALVAIALALVAPRRR